MAHHVYETDAIIIRTIGVGEGSQLVACYTSTHGMLYVQTRSSREERSKMRYALSPFSKVRTLLVRGAGTWRLRGIDQIDGSLFDLTRGQQRTLGARLMWVTQRLVHGEGANSQLFGALWDAHHILMHHKLSPLQLSSLERITLVKILAALGYATLPPQFLPTITSSISIDHLHIPSHLEKLYTQIINTAFKESHL